MLLMAVRGEFDAVPDYAIFADTQCEPQAVYEHLDWLEQEVAGTVPILRVTAGNLMEDSLRSRYGYRFATMPLFVRNPDGGVGMLRRQCTREYKIAIITRTIRELLGIPRGRRVPYGVRVEQWLGISVDEIHRAKAGRERWIETRFPLLEKRMRRWDCIVWLKRHGYPIPPKSSCIVCPYHDNAYWRDMRDNRPDEWRRAVEFDREIRRGLRGVEQEAYLHRQLVPLDEADIDGVDQVSLFGEECEGMCGF